LQSLGFRIRGLDSEQLRRWKRLTRPSSTRRKLITTAAIAWAGYGILGPPTASIRGSSVSAYRVVVLVDSSTSMPDFNTAVKPQLDRLQAAGIPIGNQSNVPGWSWGSATGYGFLSALETALAASPNADAVFLVSDFAAGDDSDNNTAGELRLRQLLIGHGLHLYFSTVHLPVPQPYRQLAESTGGGIVP